MSRLFGELRQVGIVVRDIEAAMKHWVEVCGVGPWFYTDKLGVTEFSYRGSATTTFTSRSHSPTRATCSSS